MIEDNTNRNVKIILALLSLLLLPLLSNLALSEATPEGANITVINTSRRTADAPTTLNAAAGNVSQLNLIANTITQTWQGYYGNITGTILLDDSGGNTLYSWDLAQPEGEIYVSETTIDFSFANIECYNYTKTGGSYLNLSSFESSLGLASDDADGVNETFTPGTSYDSFYAGTNLINNTCPETQLFNSSESQDPNQFQEVLLYDLTSDKVIYAGILEEDPILGFNNQYWDFEMIVGEDGHNGDTTTTTYYFYVELE